MLMIMDRIIMGGTIRIINLWLLKTQGIFGRSLIRMKEATVKLKYF